MTHTVAIHPQSKYALQYFNGRFIDGKMVFDVRVVKVKP